jgi:hypothetical protein
MASRKDSRAKRRKQFLNSAVIRRPTDYSMRKFYGDAPPRGNSFDNPHLWDTAARYALTLDLPPAVLDGVPAPDIFAEPLRNAFQEFRLDPVDPYSWRYLCSIFAYIEFGKRLRGQPGAPKKWTKLRLAELHAAAEHLRMASPRISDVEIARTLARNPHFKTENTSATAGREGLRRAIRKARRTRS